jgi:hypothetical protein
MEPLGAFLRSDKMRRAINLALAAFAIVLCWMAVSWAFRPGLSMMLDEISNLTWFLWGPYSNAVHFFPVAFYNDRPIGFAFFKLLDELFGLDYTRQVACLLAIHFANCVLAFVLFRRLGAGVPLSLAAMGLYASLSTTVLTATYIGSAFDVICLFFILASALAVLSHKRGSTALSAVLFLAALRSKEFAIVTPVLLTILVVLNSPRLIRRLWMHYLILLVFGVRYLFLLPSFLARSPAQDPYHMDFHVATVLQSLAYYTTLIFGMRWPAPSWLLAALLAAVFAWAVVRRKAGVAFGIAGFVLTALPVLFLPNSRQPYWMYAPQLFLILAVCLLMEEILARFCREPLRWAVAACIALVCLSAATRFRRSPVLWHISVRRACMRTTTDAAVQIPKLGPGTHIYVNHGLETPWLFMAGPCDYFKLINQQRGISCVLGKPADQLRAMYASDSGPKYLVDYRKDGSITVTARNSGYR